jgi:hypothetical protein
VFQQHGAARLLDHWHALQKLSNGELYVMIYYENGEPQMEVLNKHNKQLGTKPRVSLLQ